MKLPFRGLVRAGRLFQWLASLHSSLEHVAEGDRIEVGNGVVISYRPGTLHRFKLLGGPRVWTIAPGITTGSMYPDDKVPTLDDVPLTDLPTFNALAPFWVSIRWEYTPEVEYDGGASVTHWAAQPTIVVTGPPPVDTTPVVSYDSVLETVDVSGGIAHLPIAYVTESGRIIQFLTA